MKKLFEVINRRCKGKELFLPFYLFTFLLFYFSLLVPVWDSPMVVGMTTILLWW